MSSTRAKPRFADGSAAILATPTVAAMPASLSGGSESNDYDTWDSAEWEEIVKVLVPSTPASGSDAAPARATPANQTADEPHPWIPASEAFNAAPLAARSSATDIPVAEDGTAAMDELPMMQMFAAVATAGLWSQRIDTRAARRLMTTRA